MNDRQRRFVEEYLVDLNATQAATRAGYSAKTARAIGARLLTHVDIVAALTDARTKRTERVEVTQDYVLGRLIDNVERAMQAEPVRDKDGNEAGEYTYQGSVANAALALLGKHLGMFGDKLDVTSAGQRFTLAIGDGHRPIPNRLAGVDIGNGTGTGHG